MTGCPEQPPGIFDQEAFDSELGIHLPKSVQTLMHAMNLAYTDLSVANLEAWIFCILEQVPEYTNVKRRNAHARAPSRIEVQRKLESQDVAITRRVKTPIGDLKAEETRSMTLTEVFARLACHITTQLEKHRVTGQESLLEDTPTFSSTYRSHQQPDRAKFKLVMALVGWINTQFYFPGIFHNDDAQLRIRSICETYIQRSNVDGSFEVVNDIAPCIQYFFPLGLDLGEHVLERAEESFPASFQEFKKLLYDRFSFNRRRVAITKLFCRSGNIPSKVRVVTNDAQWKGLMDRHLDVYNLAVVHAYTPPYGVQGDSGELGYIPQDIDRIGLFTCSNEAGTRDRP